MDRATVKKLDKLFSVYIRLRDKLTCKKCGARFEMWRNDKGEIKISQGYHCAHIMSRVHRNTRWSDDNAISLCYGCHSFFDREHEYRWVWLKTIGYTDESIDLLRHRSQQKFSGDWKLIEIYLRQKIDELKCNGLTKDGRMVGKGKLRENIRPEQSFSPI